MPTTKYRINITTDAEIEKTLKTIAKRDHVPVATKAAELLRLAIEIEEDIALAAIVDQRSKKKVKFISHEDFWK